MPVDGNIFQIRRVEILFIMHYAFIFERLFCFLLLRSLLHDMFVEYACLMVAMETLEIKVQQVCYFHRTSFSSKFSKGTITPGEL
jgi:hypothetical protein